MSPEFMFLGGFLFGMATTSMIVLVLFWLKERYEDE